MFTKEEILCGTKQELSDYLYGTYKFVLRTAENAYDPNTNFDGLPPTGDKKTALTVKEQLDLIEQTQAKVGMVSFLMIGDVDMQDGIPNVKIKFGKIWVFIRPM